MGGRGGSPLALAAADSGATERSGRPLRADACPIAPVMPFGRVSQLLTAVIRARRSVRIDVVQWTTLRFLARVRTCATAGGAWDDHCHDCSWHAVRGSNA